MAGAAAFCALASGQCSLEEEQCPHKLKPTKFNRCSCVARRASDQHKLRKHSCAPIFSSDVLEVRAREFSTRPGFSRLALSEHMMCNGLGAPLLC
jgi:hypothetical protein